MAKQKSKNDKNYIRLDRLLAEAGFGTRSEVKKLLNKGVVRLEAKVLNNPGQRIRPEEVKAITVFNQDLDWQPELHYLLNKPAGVVTALRDGYYPVVYEYLPELELKRKAMAVGRLDLDTTGLLLFTTDGQLNHRLSSPKYKIPKRYHFTYKGPEFSAQDLAAVEDGLLLPGDLRLRPAELRPLETGVAELIISEGIYHQVKRMVEALGRKLETLSRLSLGPLELDPELDYGEGRSLRPEEISALYAAVEGE
ncbi:MAG: pseudouridine synthase [Eubacteriales bacterium]|nr:pseudouridine synthase [Eubacteriales bacterium]